MASVLDIRRQRDEGLPLCDSVREAFGLSRVENYEDLAGDNQKIVEILRNFLGKKWIKRINACVGTLIE